MIIARWTIHARFGHKQPAIDLMNKWLDEIGSQIGWTRDRARMLTGSIGAKESCIQSEFELSDLTELNQAWDKLAKIDAHKQWSKDLEPYVVSGTPHWEIYRVL